MKLTDEQIVWLEENKNELVAVGCKPSIIDEYINRIRKPHIMTWDALQSYV